MISAQDQKKAQESGIHRCVILVWDSYGRSRKRPGGLHHVAHAGLIRMHQRLAVASRTPLPAADIATPAWTHSRARRGEPRLDRGRTGRLDAPDTYQRQAMCDSCARLPLLQRYEHRDVFTPPPVGHLPSGGMIGF